VVTQGVQEADLTGLLERIRAQTLLICGDLDTYARDGQHALRDDIANSRLERAGAFRGARRSLRSHVSARERRLANA